MIYVYSIRNEHRRSLCFVKSSPFGFYFSGHANHISYESYLNDVADYTSDAAVYHTPNIRAAQIRANPWHGRPGWINLELPSPRCLSPNYAALIRIRRDDENKKKPARDMGRSRIQIFKNDSNWGALQAPRGSSFGTWILWHANSVSISR